MLLPPGYRDPANKTQRYPVLYLTDGQSLFGACSVAEWHADRVIAHLISTKRIPPVIVVGMDHGGRRFRAKEYLPWGDSALSPPELEPGGKYFPAFVLDEVVPFIEKHYRVARGSANRFIGGASYGAGAALFAAMERPGSFGGLLLESPSLSPDNYHLMHNAEVVKAWPRKVYIGTGTVREPVSDVRQLEYLLKKHKVNLLVKIETGAGTEKAWGQRLAISLPFLLGAGR